MQEPGSKGKKHVGTTNGESSYLLLTYLLREVKIILILVDAVGISETEISDHVVPRIGN